MTQGSKVVIVAGATALCRLDAINDGDAMAVDAVLDGIEQGLVVLRRGDQAHVYVNICPHAGRRLDWAPGRFLVKDGILVCAVHGSSFQTDTGLCVSGPCRGDSLRELPATVIDNQVVLDPPA